MSRTITTILICCMLLFSISCDLFCPSSEESISITPSVYRMAVINLALFDSSSNSVNVVNASRETPEVINFAPNATNADGSSFSDILNNPSGAYTPGETYEHYDIVPLYIEVEMLAAFHFPTTATEDTYALEFTTDGDEDTYTFRFYFNPVDNLWKRDILVHLDDTQIDSPVRAAYPSGWYWMRRGVEPGNANFLILAQEDGVDYADPSNDFPEHPDSASGSTSVIDLFSDDPFWGSSSAYDTYDPSNPVHIDSATGTGGMNAVLPPFTYTTGATITAVPDVTATFNFWHFSDPADADFTVPADANVVDFGPDSGSEKHGDWGFHPFMPQFTITAAR